MPAHACVDAEQRSLRRELLALILLHAFAIRRTLCTADGVQIAPKCDLKQLQ
eukprot:COSAG03_NODE_27989_length_238_cov_3.424460_1_plen_51_part_01